MKTEMQEQNEEMKIIFQTMADKWPSAIVARTEVERFSGGMIKGKYIANLDSTGQGPAGRIRCGRKVAYPVNEFVKWLESRSEVLTERKK